MEKNSEQTHESVAAPSSPQGSTRRHFLKGTTLALPAVVTLHSGTALAATSLGCGGFNGNTQGYVKVLCDSNNPPEDNRFRVPVLLYRKLVKTTVTSRGKPNTVKWEVDKNNTGHYFKGKVGATDTWRFVVAGPLVVAGTPVTGDELDAVRKAAISHQDIINVQFFATTTKKYAIAHVATQSGAIVAVGTPTTDKVMNAIVTSWTGACLTSLYGAKLV